MKWFLAALISCLALELSTSKVIRSRVKSEVEQIGLEERSNGDKLVFVHIIYRHGDRLLGPPRDLTKEGKRQMYEAGQFFRRRYDDILGDKYSPEKVYVLSTDHDRSIMSAQANLAGLFFPSEEEKWNKDILWQPVPVHIVPNELDTKLRGGRKCPRYDILYEYFMEKVPEAVELMTKYGHLIDHWAEMKGKGGPKRGLKSISDITNLYKKLTTEKSQNKQLEAWAEEAIKPDGPMEIIKRTTFKLRGAPELVRIRSGFLLKEILEHFSQKINGTLQPDRVMWLYSGHSGTIAAMLNGLGLFEVDVPPFASSLHFELYKDKENTHYIQLIYRKPGEEHPKPLDIPGCGVKCPLNQFYSLFKQLIPDDFETECNLDEPKSIT